MVLHVQHVVVDYETESAGLIGTDVARRVERVIGNLFDQMDKEQIVLLPQRDDGGPGELIVGMQANPIVLRIAGTLIGSVESCADKALVIVGG